MQSFVLDSSALWAFLQHKPSGPKVAALLVEAAGQRALIFMSAVNYGEVYGLILREQGPDRARQLARMLEPLSIQIVEPTVQQCCRAAEVKARYRLYYIDAFAAALALEHKATLVTSDSDFRRLGHGFPILWLKP